MDNYTEYMVADGQIVQACPCDLEFYRGAHCEPTCPYYCAWCNYDRHMCPGCGTVAGHDEGVCADCEAELHG